MAKLAVQFMKRVEYILSTENVTYEKQVVAAVIQKHFPDWRRVLNELQRYSATGAIDSGILTNLENITIKDLILCLKDKRFDDVRKWVHDNADQDHSAIFRSMFDTADTYFTKRSVPILVLKIAEYQYKASFSADQEINLLAFMIELMMECEFQ